MAGYRDLKVWQLGMDLALDVYRVTSEFPKSEIYGLTSQIRRAVVSIPSNIAEGHARRTPREMQRFANIAKGSLAELETQLILAGELGYLSKDALKRILQMTEHESRMLSGLLRSIQESR
jgi:four helix bundle protein